MNERNAPRFLRAPFFGAGEAAPQAGAGLLRALLAQDGSTTRVCQAIAGEPLHLEVVRQGLVEAVPEVVHALLPGQRFMERATFLAARGEVMMDNLVYVAVEALSPELRAGLEGGSIPIGRLLDTLWVRRRALPRGADAGALFARLWAIFGAQDASASRAYTIESPEGPLFLIAECYRRGMRMEPGGAGRGLLAESP